MNIELHTQLQYFAFAAPMAAMVGIFAILLAIAVLVTRVTTRRQVIDWIHLHLDDISRKTVMDALIQNEWLTRENARLTERNRMLSGIVRSVQAHVSTCASEEDK